MTPTPETVLQEVRALARPETHRALEAALEWGLPKCRTEEERLLYPALLLVLGNLNALVTTRRLEPDELAGFHLTLSRARSGSPPERAHLILRVAVDEAARARGDDELCLPAAAVRTRPLACAAEVLAALLARASTRDQRDSS